MGYFEFEDPIIPPTSQYQVEDTSSPIKTLALVASVAAAVQYGWALQLSLLTPYIQLLGVPHEWAAFVWLCGPISGLVIQPTIGHYSDNCTSRFGRRRPFIAVGAVLLCLSVSLIGFAADIGIALGDSLNSVTKPRAVGFFVLGFWIMDISNNVIQGPCRALLADLSGENEAKLMIANALFAFFMAVGNILGYGLGSYVKLYSLFPFTQTQACDQYCANLKTCFLFSIFLAIIAVTLVVVTVKEEVHVPYTPTILQRGQSYNDNMEYENKEELPLSFFGQLTFSLAHLSIPMRNLLIVTGLNWIGWFPFTMFGTDWMGKEVYGGEVDGDPRSVALYHDGVWAGTKGLMLYVVSLGLVSLYMEPLVRACGNVKKLWGSCNFILAICMVVTAYITKLASAARHSDAGTRIVGEPPYYLKIPAWGLFAILGIPQAVTYSVPFALASVYANENGTGQALGLGVVNLGIVIPQMPVAIVSGPLDATFDGSNLPAFFMGAIAAGVSGVLAFTILRV